MVRQTLQHLLALREVNKALIDGLKAGVYFLDKVEEISEEQRKSMIESLNGIIAESGAVYGEGPKCNLICKPNQNSLVKYWA